MRQAGIELQARIQCQPSGEEQGRLVAVAERRNLPLQRLLQLEAEVGDHDQVAGGLVLGGVEQAGVQVGGEEEDVTELLAQGLQDEELVVDVAAQDSDRPETFFALPLQVAVESSEPPGETLQVVETPAAYRALGR